MLHFQISYNFDFGKKNESAMVAPFYNSEVDFRVFVAVVPVATTTVSNNAYF